jgi:GNAT superfamily N-acetyltransferase
MDSILRAAPAHNLAESPGPIVTEHSIPKSSAKVRVAVADDGEALMLLINAAFRKAESFFVDGDRVTLEFVRASLKKGTFLVSEDSDKLTGCVYVEPLGERAYLGLLSVDPENQRSGIGSRLMNAAEDFCAKAGCRFVDLRIVSIREELPGFYRRHGYVESATLPFIEGVATRIPCHFVQMTKRLG